VPIDPSLAGARIGAKAGFDCTRPVGVERGLSSHVPVPPVLEASSYDSALAALDTGPASFAELMAAERTRDERVILRLLEPLYAGGRLSRDADGRYRLGAADQTNSTD
jgi:hypothetical protein